MELTQTLDITPEEFFDQIEKSVLRDIEEATGKQVSRRKLPGFRYEKVARGGGKAGTPMRVKIRKYRYPEVYEVRFTYATGTNTVTYRATPTEGGMQLDYAEQLTSPQPVTGILGQLRLKRYESRARRRALKTIQSICQVAREDRRVRATNPLADELERVEAGGAESSNTL